ncbi:lysosomal acid glucosylceramidase-like [Pieris brassicae]|uniref:lysosomal acid glucosylceramidase-like n=1 Tax=Pieris brassicae TaxID=7116 RepID=UPI001E660806|nr:lysosomal acid glucosylceramidase-like [Pieris brassicae]
MGITKVIFLLALFGSGFVLCEDQPCASRDGDNAESFVCVCNSTYCDTVSREPPAVGSYVIYTSSKSGKRLEKSNGIIESYSNLAQGQSEECDISDLYSEMAFGEDESCAERFWSSVSLDLQTDNRQQYVEGFGGSITDAVAYNWYKLSEETRSRLISTYFGEDGLGYNMIRIPIGGSDFSTRPYTYNDYPLDDETLSNFTLAEEDTSMKIPMIKAIQEIRKEELKIIASTWCPPVWMKNNEGFYGYGQLKPQYYQSYADYHVRFIEEYEKLDIKIWAITTTNRPTGGIIPDKNINSLGWFPADLGRWLAINLGPTLRSSRYNKTLIFAVDDELHMLDWYLHGMQKADKSVMKYIDGIAVHYYSSSSSPSLLLDSIKKKYKKTILGTQACEGSTGWDSTTVKIGSWERAARYIRSIVDDMNHHSVGWMDFNLFLDKNGGPNWAGNYVDAPILIYPDKDEFIKQPMFYALAHFTKFIPKGSQRITIVTKSIVEITNLSFVTPEGNILIILYNSNSRTVNVHVRLSSKRYIEVIIEKETIKTIEINPNESILCKVQC